MDTRPLIIATGISLSFISAKFLADSRKPPPDPLWEKILENRKQNAIK